MYICDADRTVDGSLSLYGIQSGSWLDKSNNDGKVSMPEAATVTDIFSLKVKDFTGIEYFSDLRSIDSSSVETIDLRYNSELTSIEFVCSDKIQIDLSYNRKLTTINEYSFSWCLSLKSVILPSSLTTIGENAFYKCSLLNTVISEVATPPSLYSEVFYGIDDSAVLYVPSESIDAYKNSDWADYFAEILPI